MPAQIDRSTCAKGRTSWPFALEDNVRFYHVVHGRREQLKGADVRVTPNQWHSLGLRAEGNRFTISYDGKTLFSATDNTFARPAELRFGPRPTA